MKRLAAMMGIVMMGLTVQAWGTQIVNPKWNGYALDWCASFEGACGKPAADLYCQKKGFLNANSFIKRVGVSYPTMTVGSNAVCNPAYHHCDTFASIDCRPKAQTFFAPTWNGFRLDWCNQFEQGCGALAAKNFCNKKGYAFLGVFSKQANVSVQTMTVGSNAICNPAYHGCDSFNYIQCKN